MFHQTIPVGFAPDCQVDLMNKGLRPKDCVSGIGKVFDKKVKVGGRVIVAWSSTSSFEGSFLKWLHAIVEASLIWSTSLLLGYIQAGRGFSCLEHCTEADWSPLLCIWWIGAQLLYCAGEGHCLGLQMLRSWMVESGIMVGMDPIKDSLTVQ